MMVMSKLLPKTSESFKPSINSFMSTCNLLLSTLLTLVAEMTWFSDCWISSISSICFNYFTRGEHWLHKLSEDCNICPLTCFKRTMTRDYISSLDASTNAISKTSDLKLVAVVCWIKRIRTPLWFTLFLRIWFVEDPEVNTIMIYLACLSFIIFQSVFESDLRRSRAW